MNEVDREVLSFMRDVETPEQGAFYLDLINDNIDGEIRQSHLLRLEGIGMIQATGGEISDSKSYYLTAEGLQAITTDDLVGKLEITNQQLSRTSERLSDLQETNQRLDDTVEELQSLQDSQAKSSAVQTIFSFTIIGFTTFQIVSSQVRNPIQEAAWSTLGIMSIGLILMVFAFVIGAESINYSLESIIQDVRK